MLRDLKAATYSECDAAQLAACKPNSPNTRTMLAPVFNRVALVYGHSNLATAEHKVAAVKDIMTASVARALQSVEHLEDMEESSERFEEQSKQFHKKTVAVKKQHRKKYETAVHTRIQTHARSWSRPAHACSGVMEVPCSRIFCSELHCTALHWLTVLSYWVLGVLFAVVILAVILYFAIPAAIKSSSSSSVNSSSSSSSTGAGR